MNAFIQYKVNDNATPVLYSEIRYNPSHLINLGYNLSEIDIKIDPNSFIRRLRSGEIVSLIEKTNAKIWTLPDDYVLVLTATGPGYVSMSFLTERNY